MNQKRFFIQIFIVAVFALNAIVASAGSGSPAHQDENVAESCTSIVSGKMIISPLDHSAQAHKCPAGDHDSDCHCPIHRAHCCGSTAAIDTNHRSAFLSAVDSIAQYTLATYHVKSAPTLDGPYQPPRA